VRFEEGAGADLQSDGRHEAAQGLGRLDGDGGGVHGEHHDVDDEEACMNISL